MKHPLVAFILASGCLFAQTAKSTKAAGKTWVVPRTVDGQPDLQGVWTNATITPLERPAELSGKQTFTPEEAADFEKRAFAAVSSERRDGGNAADLGRSYNDFWRDRGTKVIGSRRTSLITDPPDGRVPALTPAGQKRVNAANEFARLHPADGPESMNPWVRCITRGVPMVPGPYNNDFQIIQSRDYVVIFHEMIHETRIVPLDGRPHAPSGVRSYLGDPRGHWEGDTLVVDSTNFSANSNFRGSSENLHLVERFTRVNAETIDYQFTVEDPATFTEPWSAEIPMTPLSNPIYEYACNEGNYAMSGILAGARSDEAKRK